MGPFFFSGGKRCQNTTTLSQTCTCIKTGKTVLRLGSTNQDENKLADEREQKRLPEFSHVLSNLFDQLYNAQPFVTTLNRNTEEDLPLLNLRKLALTQSLQEPLVSLLMLDVLIAPKNPSELMFND